MKIVRKNLLNILIMCQLSEIFDYIDEDLKKSTEKFLKRLDNIIKKCFKKVGIKEKNKKHEEQLFKQRNILKNKTDANSKNKLFDINKI